MDKSTKPHPSWSLPPARSPFAQEAQKRFLFNYQTGLRADWESISLTVMVWGPGVTRPTPMAVKRHQIKNRLLEVGHNPLFSEDIKGDDDPLHKELPGVEGLMLKETYQADYADFVVLLLDEGDLTPGVQAELEICADPYIASKVFVMAPALLKNSFTHKVAIAPIEGGNGAVYWYTDDELAQCNVLTEAIYRVEQKRYILVRQLRLSRKATT